MKLSVENFRMRAELFKTKLDLMSIVFYSVEYIFLYPQLPFESVCNGGMFIPDTVMAWKSVTMILDL